MKSFIVSFILSALVTSWIDPDDFIYFMFICMCFITPIVYAIGLGLTPKYRYTTSTKKSNVPSKPYYKDEFEEYQHWRIVTRKK